MNHYETLGITRNATQEEIAGAFRSLAKQYHPDHNNAPDAKNRFIRIYEAYSILKDENKRKVYDALVFKKTEDVKTETEQAKTYTQWQETAKKEAERYSETKFSEFKKEVFESVKFGCMSRLVFLGFMALIIPIVMLCQSIADQQYIKPKYEVIDGTITITGYGGNPKNIHIPAAINGLPVTAIGDRAFRNVKTLKSVTIPNTVTTIGDWAFFLCSNLEGITIPDSVTTIGEYAFSYCDKITSVNIPATVTAMYRSFYSCRSLTSINVDPQNSAYMSVDGVLFTKSGETLISYPTVRSGAYEIPPTVTTIGAGAFASCKGLASVTIPPSVTIIEELAFAASGLNSVTVPASVTDIGEKAFDEGVRINREKESPGH